MVGVDSLARNYFLSNYFMVLNISFSEFFDVEMIFIFIEKLNFGNTLLLFFEKDTRVINISQSTYFSRDNTSLTSPDVKSKKLDF